MKKQLIIFLILIFSKMFSQEMNSKWSHAIAGGASYCLDQNVDAGPITSIVKYKFPGYILFYRLVQRTENGFNCLGLNANYRSGTVNTTNAGTSTTYKIYGNVNWCRLDLNFAHLLVIGKNNDFAFGPGVYAGALIYSGGNTKVDESATGGGFQTYDIKTNDILNKTHIGFNIEIQQKIDISETGAIILGLRVGLESPDGFSLPKFTKLASGYIGYQFCKKKKVKLEQKTETDR